MELTEEHLLALEATMALLLFAIRWKFSDVNESEQYFGIIAQYVFYILLMKGISIGFKLGCNLYMKKYVDINKEIKKHKTHLILMAGAGGTLLYFRQTIFDGWILLFYIAHIIIKYSEMQKPITINYGVGMACSFYEGYLVHILPNDGSENEGFIHKIIKFQNSQKVIFPVKVLFIIITKTLYCPPDLAEFNKLDRTDLAHLEAARSLEDVTKDVAGVKSRQYRNSAYKIVRPGAKPVVHVAAECATPLHTLYRVLAKRALYHQLCDVDAEELRNDFCKQLETVIERNPASRGKCVLVYFDNTNDKLNLADVLLEKIAELEPRFEKIIKPEEE